MERTLVEGHSGNIHARSVGIKETEVNNLTAYPHATLETRQYLYASYTVVQIIYDPCSGPVTLSAGRKKR